MSTFEKSVTFQPAYDKRDPDPKKNYGIHGVTIRFVLKGEKGATEFVIYTDWDLPHVQKEGKRDESSYFELKPMGADIGYHSYKSHYESQKPMEKCDILGCDCYYDGSSLQASDFIPKFLEGGSDAVWAMLESRYKTWFEEGWFEEGDSLEDLKSAITELKRFRPEDEQQNQFLDQILSDVLESYGFKICQSCSEIVGSNWFIENTCTKCHYIHLDKQEDSRINWETRNK